MRVSRTQWAWILLAGITAGAALWFMSASQHANSQDQKKPGQDGPALIAKVDALQKDVERLKQGAVDQAHAMVSVAYHFNNLWFAGQHGNWPLAQFYLNETRSHLRWAVRIIPVRKTSAGMEVKLADILQAVENTPLKELEAAIKTKNRDGFVAAYRSTLSNGCYACHKASEKEYLRLRVPMQPPEPIIDFDKTKD